MNACDGLWYGLFLIVYHHDAVDDAYDDLNNHTSNGFSIVQDNILLCPSQILTSRHPILCERHTEQAELNKLPGARSVKAVHAWEAQRS